MENVDRAKWKLLLKSIAFFKSFEDDELDHLLDFAEVRKYHLHNYIIQEGKHDFNFYVILRGAVSIIKGSHLEGKQKISSLPQGSCFGEISVLLNEPRSASVMAAGEVAVFSINGKQIDGLELKTREKIFKQLAINLARHLKSTSNQVAGSTAHKPFDEK